MNQVKIIDEAVRLVAEGVCVTLPVGGRSMLPFIIGGKESVILQQATQPGVGDVVLAWVEQRRYVLHRIISIKGDEVILRGDGNVGVEHCHRNDVKGFAIGFYRKGRKKIDKTNSFKWRFYSLVWCLLLPVRPYLLAAYRRLWLTHFKPI